jgi:hypothetical protein
VQKQSSFVVSGQFPAKSHSPRRKPNMRPSSLAEAFDNVDPRRVARSHHRDSSGKLVSASSHPALIHTAPSQPTSSQEPSFSYAIRRYSKPQIAGKTKCVDLDGSYSVLQVTSLSTMLTPNFISEFVTVTFVNQKNGRKMDSRTQRRTGGSRPLPRHSLRSQSTEDPPNGAQRNGNPPPSTPSL